MISIDTNVLLRYLLQDDKSQSTKATALINDHDPILITDVVLSETLWTLRGKRYSLDKDALVNVLYALFAEPNLMFEQPLVVWRALNDYRKAKGADFPDALIVNKARHTALEQGHDFQGVYTFDKGAQHIPGTCKP